MTSPKRGGPLQSFITFRIWLKTHFWRSTQLASLNSSRLYGRHSHEDTTCALCELTVPRPGQTGSVERVAERTWGQNMSYSFIRSRNMTYQDLLEVLKVRSENKTKKQVMAKMLPD